MVAAWHERLSPLADSYGLASPPSALKRRIESRLFGTPAEIEPARGWWNSLTLWRPLAIAASLAVVVLAGIQFLGPSRVAGPPLIAALAADNGPVRYLAYYDRQTEKLTLQRLDQPPAQGRDHELWLVAGGNAPIPLGVLAHADASSIALRPDLAEEIASGSVLAVSDEPLGGSPTGVRDRPGDRRRPDPKLLKFPRKFFETIRLAGPSLRLP